MCARLDEDRRIIDHDGPWSLSRNLTSKSGLFTRNPRMNDAPKSPQLARMTEHQIPQRRSVEGPVGMKNPPAEHLHHFAPSRFSGLHNPAREQVGVDHIGSAGLKHASGRRFPCRHAPRQADHNHAARIPSG